MTCVYIHYTASIVMADSFFWPEYTFKMYCGDDALNIILQI